MRLLLAAAAGVIGVTSLNVSRPGPTTPAEAVVTVSVDLRRTRDAAAMEARIVTR